MQKPPENPGVSSFCLVYKTAALPLSYTSENSAISSELSAVSTFGFR
jgi:hypothetical protein